MKRLLFGGLAAAALVVPGAGVRAADMAVKAPPAPAYVSPSVFNWTGFYIGANIGGGWAGGNLTDTLTGANFGVGTQSAFIGGGQIGYNFQISPNVVLGVEWFMDGVASNNNNSSNTVFVPALGNSFLASAQTDWVSTLTGRIGITAPGSDRWLIYAKGGGGWVQNQATVTNLNTGLSASTTQTRGGWVGGVGIEWAFASNWTAKLEYQYLGLSDFSVSPGFVTDTFNVTNPNIQMVTVGVNYLFNWGTPAPVVTRY